MWFWLLAALVVVIVAAVYWLTTVYVIVPMALAAAALGAVLGAALAVLSYLRVFAGLAPECEVLRPGSLPDRAATAPYPKWDNGWPHYLTGQVVHDLVAAAALPWTVVRSLWRRVWRLTAIPGGVLLATAPLVPLPLLFAGCLTAGLCLTWLATGVVVAGVAAVGLAVGLAAVGVLRSVDLTVQWWNGAAATCPACAWVTRLPAYLCPCGSVHHDLRAGRLGVWLRRCGCGAHLPTTVLRANRRLAPVCPRCHEALPDSAGVIRDIRIAVSGGPRAGKTALLVAGIEAMRRHALAAGRCCEPADTQSRSWLAGPGEPASDSPRAMVTMRTAGGLLPSYLHVVDVPGELFRADLPDAPLWHLGTTTTHLFVLDPLTIPAVRDRLRHPEVSGSSGGSVTDAELPYHVMVAQIRGYGMRTERCSLAVVVSKADRLLAEEVDLPGPGARTSGQVKAWLRRMGLDNLVLAAGRDFKKVHYFLSGTLATPGVDPASALEWLATRHPKGPGGR